MHRESSSPPVRRIRHTRASTSSPAQRPTAVRSTAHLALELAVDSLFARQIDRDGPGCASGIYQDGEVLLTRGYGLANVEDGRPITVRTTFKLGAASKPFRALAVLILEQRGRLSLDDDVRRWVPELPEYGALGLLLGRDVTTMAEFLGQVAAQQALNFTPGTRHEYSHSDYLQLGLVVERVGRGLALRQSGQAGLNELLAETPTRFFQKGSGMVFSVESANGKVERLVVEAGGQRLTANRRP